MGEFFQSLLEISIMASFVIIAVLLVRLCMRKKNALFKCVLWLLVGLRLLIPINVSTPFGLMPEIEISMVEKTAEDLMQRENPVNSKQHENSDEMQTDGNENSAPDGSVVENMGNVFQGNLPEENTGLAHEMSGDSSVAQAGVPKGETQDIMWGKVYSVLSVIWLCGMLAMLGYMLFSGLRLRRELGTAVPDMVCYGGDLVKVYRNANISSPFLLGVLSPKIYVPYHMSEQDLQFVLAHELAHIRRGDHFWKPLSFVILSVYWFHPLVWVAYRLAGRDIEAACDERVMRRNPAMDRTAYASVLLACASGQHKIAVCPVAFGESDVKKRVKNVLRYRKPGFWTLISCSVIGVVVALCFMTVSADNSEGVVDGAVDGKVQEESQATSMQQEQQNLEEELAEQQAQAEEALREKQEQSEATPAPTPETEKVSLTMEQLLEWTNKSVFQLYVKQKGLSMFQSYDNVVVEDVADMVPGQVSISYFCDLSYREREYRMQIMCNQSGIIEGIYIRYPQVDDGIMIYTADSRYQVTDLQEFLERTYGLDQYITYTLPEGFTLGSYKMRRILDYNGSVLVGDVEEQFHGESASEWVYAPGGIATFTDFYPIKFENGEPINVIWMTNHMGVDSETVEKLEGCFTSALLAECGFDLFTAAEQGEYLEQHPEATFEDVKGSTYWYVFICNESSDVGYVVCLNQLYFTKDDVIALARSIQPK